MKAANEKTAKVLDSHGPEPRSIQTRGGKLILYHGWNSPLSTINDYNTVASKMG